LIYGNNINLLFSLLLYHMKYIITFYHYSCKLTNITENFEKLKQLELSDDVFCVHHKTGHKCKFSQHSSTKKFLGSSKMISFVIKYENINIRISIFQSGNAIINYNHKKEFQVDEIINNLAENFDFEIGITKSQLVTKTVEWRTINNNLSDIKTHVQNNYKGNYDIIEHESSLFPSLFFTVRGNKIRIGKKSVRCSYRRINDKEIDNFMSILQKYYDNSTGKTEDGEITVDKDIESEDDEKHDEIENDMMDKDIPLTIII